MLDLMLIDYGYISASLFGIIVFIYSGYKIFKIMKLLPAKSRTRTYWIYAIILTILFALGYVVTILVILTNNKSFLDSITPIIYLLGAIFVFIMVTVSLRTYKAILDSAE